VSGQSDPAPLAARCGCPELPRRFRGPVHRVRAGLDRSWEWASMSGSGCVLAQVMAPGAVVSWVPGTHRRPRH